MFSSLVCSEEIKLSCTIKLLRVYSIDGSSETNQYREVLEVTDNSNYKSIIPLSDNFGSVSTRKHSETDTITDYSNSNSWDISSSRTSSEGHQGLTSYRIDRNTGDLWYSRTFNNQSMIITSTGTGNCEKIDVTKKKF
jgi:hypothetical protein